MEKQKLEMVRTVLIERGFEVMTTSHYIHSEHMHIHSVYVKLNNKWVRIFRACEVLSIDMLMHRLYIFLESHNAVKGGDM